VGYGRRTGCKANKEHSGQSVKECTLILGPDREIGEAEAEGKSPSRYNPVMLNHVVCVGIKMTSHF
jgi:hypothetical protein